MCHLFNETAFKVTRSVLVALFLLFPFHLYALWFDDIRDHETLQKFCLLKARGFAAASFEYDSDSEKEQRLIKLAEMWAQVPDFYKDPTKATTYVQENQDRPHTPIIGSPLDYLDDYFAELMPLENSVSPLSPKYFLQEQTVKVFCDSQSKKYALLSQSTRNREPVISKKYALIAQTWDKVQEAKLAMLSFTNLDFVIYDGNLYSDSIKIEDGTPTLAISTTLSTFNSPGVAEMFDFTGLNFRISKRDPGFIFDSSVKQTPSEIMGYFYPYKNIHEAQLEYGLKVIEALKNQIHALKKGHIGEYEGIRPTPSKEDLRLSYVKEGDIDYLQNQVTVAAIHITNYRNEVIDIPSEETNTLQQTPVFTLWSYFSRIIGSSQHEESIKKVSSPQPYVPWFNRKAKVDYLRHKMNISSAMAKKLLDAGML